MSERAVIISVVLSLLLSLAADAAPQPLHLCAPPADPIEDQELLARYGMTPQEEYSRYLDDLNAYLLCLQKSQANIIEKGRFWHDRYIELFGSV